MKKVLLSLAVVCAALMVACGNAEVEKINKLVTEAAEKTKNAKSAQDVAEIATSLQAEMDKIAEEAGGKVSFGKSVDKALEKYQEAASAKLAEFGIKME